MRENRLITSVALLLVTTGTLAQPADSLAKRRPLPPQPPIPVEVVAAGKGLTFQLITSKSLAP